MRDPPGRAPSGGLIPSHRKSAGVWAPLPAGRIPAHNGDRSEVDDKYIKKLCKSFGIDLAALKKKL